MEPSRQKRHTTMKGRKTDETHPLSDRATVEAGAVRVHRLPASNGRWWLNPTVETPVLAHAGSKVLASPTQRGAPGIELTGKAFTTLMSSRYDESYYPGNWSLNLQPHCAHLTSNHLSPSGGAGESLVRASALQPRRIEQNSACPVHSA